ncbi:MAG: hypothetical protein ACREU8_11345 [Gammaproteobacteria bacterium]
MLLTMAYLKTVDPRIEEAGRLVARWPRVLYGITLPMVRPGLAWGALLVFLLAAGESRLALGGLPHPSVTGAAESRDWHRSHRLMEPAGDGLDLPARR